MQSNVSSTGTSSSAAAESSASEQAELDQAKTDKATDNINVTKLLEKGAVASPKDNKDNAQQQEVIFSLGNLLGGKNNNDGPGQLKMPPGYEYMIDMSPEDAVVLMNDRNASEVRATVNATVTRLKGAQEDYKKIHADNVKKIGEYIKKAGNSVVNLILKILLFLFLIIVAILAVAAAVVTASPQLIIAAIAAIMAMVNSGLAVISQITGKDVTFSGLLRQMAEQLTDMLVQTGMKLERAQGIAKMMAGMTGILTGMFLGDAGVLSIYFEGMGQTAGMSKKDAKIFGMVMGFIAMLLLMALTMGGGAASSAGSLTGAVSAADDFAKFATMGDDLAAFANVSDDIGNMAQAGAQITQTSADIYKAKCQHDANMIQSEMKTLQGFLAALRNTQKLDEAFLKEMMSHLAKMQEMANESVQTILKSSGASFRSMV